MATRDNKALEKRSGSYNPLTQRVWVAALGRFGSPALVNPWNGYAGDYSDEDLIGFGLRLRQDWLDRDNVYLLSFALASLAKDCKDLRLRSLWGHIRGILPGDWNVGDEQDFQE